MKDSVTKHFEKFGTEHLEELANKHLFESEEAI